MQKGDYLWAKVLSTHGSLVHKSTAQLVGQPLKIMLDIFFLLFPWKTVSEPQKPFVWCTGAVPMMGHRQQGQQGEATCMWSVKVTFSVQLWQLQWALRRALERCQGAVHILGCAYSHLRADGASLADSLPWSHLASQSHPSTPSSLIFPVYFMLTFNQVPRQNPQTYKILCLDCHIFCFLGSVYHFQHLLCSSVPFASWSGWLLLLTPLCDLVFLLKCSDGQKYPARLIATNGVTAPQKCMQQ